MIPASFDGRMKLLLGEDYERFAKAFYDSSPVKAFRINTLKITDSSRTKVLELSFGSVPFCEDGFYTEQDKVGAMPLHHAGAFYMQDPGAMSAVSALTIKPRMKILDACSAPGGKATQLAALCTDGVIVANEYVPSRAKILQGNIERMGCRNVIVTQLDTAVLASTYSKYFDIVVTDAPCSGEGMFRKNETAVSEWSEDNVRLCAKRQAEILDNTAKCVKPNGYLLYSTCTFSLEENEMTVNSFLNRHKDFILCEVPKQLRDCTANGINFEGAEHDMTACRRFYPHISLGEGQFAALMRKVSDDGYRVEYKENKKEKKPIKSCTRLPDSKEQKTVMDFLNEVLCKVPDMNLIMCGETVYLAPDAVLPKFGVYASGVAVGSISNGRVIPHHQFFSAYGMDFKVKINLKCTDEELTRYLHGEELTYSGDEKGWCAVLAEGCPLGGGKISGGSIKNHYPKGLRNR